MLAKEASACRKAEASNYCVDREPHNLGFHRLTLELSGGVAVRLERIVSQLATLARGCRSGNWTLYWPQHSMHLASSAAIDHVALQTRAHLRMACAGEELCEQ